MQNIHFVLGITALASLGAFTRYFLQLKVGNVDFPYGTLLANFLGCLLIGFFYTQNWSTEQPRFFIVLSVGFLGALTTYSSFALDIYKFAEASKWALAASYFLVTQFLAVGGVFAGAFIGKKF